MLNPLLSPYFFAIVMPCISQTSCNRTVLRGWSDRPWYIWRAVDEEIGPLPEATKGENPQRSEQHRFLKVVWIVLDDMNLMVLKVVFEPIELDGKSRCEPHVLRWSKQQDHKKLWATGRNSLMWIGDYWLGEQPKKTDFLAELPMSSLNSVTDW